MITGSISLYYKEGSSDKEYHVQLESKGTGFVVNFQYGRRGGALQAGTKTTSPVALDKAQKIFDKLINEKKGKGYTEGEDGTPYAGTEKAGELSGLIPQLLNAVDETRLQELLDDGSYIMQEKIDGVRLMVAFDKGEVIGSNRKGLVVSISAAIEAGVRELVGGGQAVLDGEAVGDVYYIFDLLEIDDEDLRPSGAEERWFRLRDLFGPREGGIARLVLMSRKPWHKRQRISELQASGAEGVVFKKWNAPYIPGCPASGGNQVKFKFVESATCLVAGINENKRSVRVQVRDRVDGSLVDIGNVTIPGNFDIPWPNELVEVRYLYAYPGGSLYQPVYLGRRGDKDAVDYLDTLKFKQGAEEV